MGSFARHSYTAEQEEWLRKNIGRYTYTELASLFNGQFGANVSGSKLSDKCIKQIHIKRNKNTGLFTKERAHSGDVANMRKIGTERTRAGYVWIKLSHTYTPGKKSNADMCKDWMPKHRYVYEQAHGKIPDGWIVVFLDRDRCNFSPDNLYAVPRCVHVRMSANGWYTDNRELTLAAIKLCQLNMKLKW